MYRGLVVLLCLACADDAQDGASPQQLLKQAIEAQQAGHFDQAVQGYRVILKQYPDAFAVRSNLGAALAGEGHYGEAITEYQRALKLQTNPQVRLNLALAYYKTGDFEKAAEALKIAHRELTDNAQVLTLLSDCDLRLGRNKEAIALLTPVQQAQPDNPTYIYLLGAALLRDGQIAAGQLLIDKILRNGDTAESRLLMGTAEYMVSDFAGAREDFEKAVALNPRLPEAQAYYGMALLSTGDQAGARKAFKTELESDPNNFVASLHMGVLLRQDEDFSTALQYLNHALLIRPGDPGVRFQIASVELAQGRLPDASRDLESLVKDSPQFIEAHVALATLYFREKRKEDGERERAIYARLNAERQAKTEVAAKTAP